MGFAEPNERPDLLPECLRAADIIDSQLPPGHLVTVREMVIEAMTGRRVDGRTSYSAENVAGKVLNLQENFKRRQQGPILRITGTIFSMVAWVMAEKILESSGSLSSAMGDVALIGMSLLSMYNMTNSWLRLSNAQQAEGAATTLLQCLVKDEEGGVESE